MGRKDGKGSFWGVGMIHTRRPLLGGGGWAGVGVGGVTRHHEVPAFRVRAVAISTAQVNLLVHSLWAPLCSSAKATLGNGAAEPQHE